MCQRDREVRIGPADGMAESDRAAVSVHLPRVETELTDRRERDSGERRGDLDELGQS